MSRAEKFIQDYTRNCSNLMQVPTLDDKGNIVPEAQPWLTTDDARRAVEIAREEIYEWLNKNAHLYIEPIETIFGRMTEQVIDELNESSK